MKALQEAHTAATRQLATARAALTALEDCSASSEAALRGELAAVRKEGSARVLALEEEVAGLRADKLRQEP